MLPRGIRHERWQKPPDGFLKMNVDAAWISNKASLGFVVRDSDGFVHRRGMHFIKHVASLEGGEAEALLYGIEWAFNNNLTHVIFEGDRANVMNRVSYPRDDVTLLGYKIQDCVSFLNSNENYAV